MNQKQIFIFLLLLSISVVGINCRSSSATGNTGNARSAVKTPDPFVKPSKRMQPLELHPDPIKFANLDLRDAVKAFKQKFGAEIEITQMSVEPNGVTISLYGNGDFTGEWRYENGGVSKLTANNQVYENPEFEKADLDASEEKVQPVEALTVVEHFQIDEIPLAKLPEVSRIAHKQIWIEGGEVKKVVISRTPSNWSATVAGNKSEIIHNFKVSEDSTTILDQDNYGRRPNINALEPDEFGQRIERINRDFGGELKMLKITVNEAAISFIARDPQKPEEFNEYYYSADGEKRKPSTVADADIRGRVEEAKAANSKVRSVEDLLFTPADFDFGLLPQIAENSLQELKLEKSKITVISIHRGEYFKYDGGDLKCEINVDGDNRRRSGFARFDGKGKLLKADKR